MSSHSRAALIIGVALLLPAGAILGMALDPPPVCHLQIVPDYTLVFVYRAVLRLSPECSFQTTLRVRKSSTINTRRNGAPYQPIRPETGAWNLGRLSSSVPPGELWTSPSWVWQSWDAAAWNPRTKMPGVWRAAEVLYAGP